MQGTQVSTNLLGTVLNRKSSVVVYSVNVYTQGGLDRERVLHLVVSGEYFVLAQLKVLLPFETKFQSVLSCLPEADRKKKNR